MALYGYSANASQGKGEQVDTYYVAVVTAERQWFLGPYTGDFGPQSAHEIAEHWRGKGASAVVMGVR